MRSGCHSGKNRFTEKEELLLRAFASADDLKVEIRKKIADRQKQNWRFCGMGSTGPYIRLCFKKSLNIARESNKNAAGFEE